MLISMRIFIDAIPLLVRSAGVKNYLFHWIVHLRRLLGDEPLRRAMGDAARRRAVASFDYARLAPRLADAIAHLGG